eukprot:989437_1
MSYVVLTFALCFVTGRSQDDIVNCDATGNPLGLQCQYFPVTAPRYCCINLQTNVLTSYTNKCLAECNNVIDPLNTVFFDNHCSPCCSMSNDPYCGGDGTCVASPQHSDAGYCNLHWSCERDLDSTYRNNCFPTDSTSCRYRDVHNMGLQCNTYDVPDPGWPSMMQQCSQCEEVPTTTAAATTSDPCANACTPDTSCSHGSLQGTCQASSDPTLCPYCDTTSTTAAATTTADPCASQCDLSGSGCYNTDERKYGVCIENLPACNVCHVSDPTTTANAATTTSASTTFDPCSNACTEGALCNSDQGICRDGTSAIPPTCNYCEHCANACTLDHPCMNGLGTCKDGSYPNSCPYCDTTQTTAAATTTADPCDGSCYGVAVGYHCPNMGVCRQDDPSVCPQCVTTQTTAAATTTADAATTGCTNECQSTPNYDSCTTANTGYECEQGADGCSTCVPKATTTSAATTYTTTTAVDTTSTATTSCDECEDTPNGCYVSGSNDNYSGICETDTDTGCKVCVPRTETTKTVTTTAATTSCDECDISPSTVTCSTDDGVYGHCKEVDGCNRCVTTQHTTTATADTTQKDDATTTANSDTTRTDDATTTEGADTTRTDDATTTKDADTTQYIIISDSDTTTNSGTTTTDSGTTSSTDAVNTQSKACRYDVGVAVSVFVMAVLSWT